MSAARSDEPAVAPLEGLGAVGVFSPGILRIPHLAAFLGADRIVFRPDVNRGSSRVDTVVGWGRKDNTRRPRAWAARHGLRYVMLEDGFVRSVGLGRDGDPPLSMVADDVGIHYDATAPCRLERLIASASLDETTLARARACIELLRTHRVSKYNDAPPRAFEASERKRVLVVDQTAGDLSLRLGMLAPDAFGGMLQAALSEHPDAEVVVKTHPDVVAGHREGHFQSRADRDRVRWLTDRVDPYSLLDHVDHVYVATSLMGFEALMADKPVTCFGVPFYAGWGLTDDRARVPTRRRARRTVEALFAAAYLAYTRYVDPETGERCELERTVEHLALQREMAEATTGTIYCVGFSAWKRGFVPSFLKTPASRVVFVRDARSAERRGLDGDTRFLVWGMRDRADLRSLSARRGIPIWRLEDGFLRSVGLGSDLHTPASLVVDRAGIYYDPTRPSGLEQILSTRDFTTAELARAARLRETIVTHGISKYNVGASNVDLQPDGRDVVLVIGQVEDDASVELGCPGIRRNADLLAEARARRPHGFVVYKPHPDVVSGNRRGAVSVADARRWADRVVDDAPLPACLAVATEVHTLTSLVGFEALLRGLPVFVYGQPFYAGWGLTDDRYPHPRRTRRLTLDELVAGALILYPRYVSRRTQTFTSPEVVVEQLRQERNARPGFGAIRASWAGRQARKLANLVRGARHAP